MKVLDSETVRVKICVSRTSLWRISQHPDFPKPIKTGGRAVCYLEHEIDEWIKTQAANRNNQQGGN